MKRRILVIGGLAAGPSAAAKAKRVDPEAEVVLFEQGEYISYGICEIPYFVSNEIGDARKLVVFTPVRLEKEKGVTANVLQTVEKILPSKKEIHIRNFNDGTTQNERYDKLIIATGSNPKTLNIEGENCRNVFAVKGLQEAYALKKFIDEERPRRAVIVGAGFIGLEMADAFVRRGIEVTMVHNGPMPMSKLEEDGKKAGIGRNPETWRDISSEHKSGLAWRRCKRHSRCGRDSRHDHRNRLCCCSRWS